MKLPKVIIRRSRKTKPRLPTPIQPRTDTGDEAELLGGMVQGMKASAPEERFAKALSKMPSVDSFEFRYTLGAPRGIQGWFEVDFVVSSRGIIFPIEVDSLFTHQMKKGRGDVLHDAKVQNELKKTGMQVWPTVIHLDMEDELIDQKWADRTAKRLFS